MENNQSKELLDLIKKNFGNNWWHERNLLLEIQFNYDDLKYLVETKQLITLNKDLNLFRIQFEKNELDLDERESEILLDLHTKLKYSDTFGIDVYRKQIYYNLIYKGYLKFSNRSLKLVNPEELYDNTKDS